MADVFRRLEGRRGRPPVDDQNAFALWEVETFPSAAGSDVQVLATEAPDVASFAIGARVGITVGATEAPDVASFSLTGVTAPTLALNATEAPDVASFAVGARVSVALLATEAPDVASFGLTGITSTALGLAATEAPDIASFTLLNTSPQPEFPVTPGFLEPDRYAALARQRARKIAVLTRAVRKKKHEGEPIAAEVANLERLVETARENAEKVAQVTITLLAAVEAQRAVEQARRRRDDEEVLLVLAHIL